jgi:hypothetical protein
LEAAPQINESSHIEQDKECSRVLKLVSQSVDSAFSLAQEVRLIFPSGQPCQLKQVAVNVENSAFRPAFLSRLKDNVSVRWAFNIWVNACKRKLLIKVI